MRRDTRVTLALGVVLIAIVPAYSRVFADDGWRARFLAAGLLALGLAALVRRLGGGGLVALLTSIVGLGYLTYVTVLPDVGLLPDASSLGSLRELLDDAAAALRDEVAPVPSLPGFTTAVAAGAWIAGYLAHELAVRLGRPGAGLVPPLVLWAMPLAVPMSDLDGAWARALPFLVGAGFVLLMGTDHGDADGGAPATTSGIAVGATALVGAFVAPMLLPGYGAAAWVDLRGGASPRGYQPIVDVTQRLQLPEERDVLRIRATERSYLRLAGLDSFDGGTWRLGPAGTGTYRPQESSLYRADRPFPPEETARVTTPGRVEVEVLDLANIYVPTPYQPTRVTGDLAEDVVWSTEGGFLATWSLVDDAEGGEPRVGVEEGVTYAVDAERPTPTIEQLRSVEVDAPTRERWTELPRDYADLEELTRSVYDRAGADTDVDRALALQDWFTEDQRFTYDLDVPALRGDDALTDFVLEDRRGYCEYFATAMAVMLRATDIPARVVVGFLPGRVTDPGDPEDPSSLTEFTVSTSDAHAWVEVLFPGYGWVTFEPTPRSDQTQMVPTEQDLAPVENLRERRVRELGELDTGEQDVPVPDVPDQDVAPADPSLPDEATGGAGDGADDGRSVLWPIVVTVLSLAGVLAAVTWRRRRHAVGHGDPDQRVLSAQRRLLVVGRRYGVGRAEHETMRELLHRWSDAGRIDDGERFADLAQAAAFGGGVDADHAEEADRLVAELEEQLRASASGRDRVVAPVRVPMETGVAGVRRTSSTALTRVRRESDRSKP